MARIRTFIAVGLPQTVRGHCVEVQKRLAELGAEVKWVAPENLHVTLLFLGEVFDREVPQICQAVADCSARHDPFRLAVENLGCFPNMRRPRVIWAGVGTGTQELVALHDDLETALLELGCYRREDRQYTPHLTLGRVESDQGADELAQALSGYAGWQGGEIDVREVQVLSSELMAGGPVYTVLSRAKLRRPEREG
jgi:2'-5' RNA ligase